MRYDLRKIELTTPLQPLLLAKDARGLGLVATWHGRPVGFLMQECAGGTRFDPARLERMLAGDVAQTSIAQQLRAELLAKIAPPRSPPRTLTIAICTRNGAERVERLLKTIAKLCQSDVARLSAIEVLIVDNASTDSQTRELARRNENLANGVALRHVFEAKAGLNFARNRALREANGNWLAFLDDDVTVDQKWLSGLLGAWAAYPDALGVTGLVLPLELESESQILFEQGGGFRRGFETIVYRGPTHPGAPLYPVAAGQFGAGANMAFQVTALRAVGAFDEALDTGQPLPGGGDLDIFQKIAAAGGPLVYEPTFTVFHEHRKDLPGLQRQYESWGRGFMAYVDATFRRNPSARPALVRLVVWWMTYMLRRTLRSLRGREPLPTRMILAEFAGGLRGLMGEYDRSRQRIRQIREQHKRSIRPSA